MTSPELRAVASRARKAREALTRRDAEIRAAREAGHSLREIAGAAGLSAPGVAKIVERGQS